jgi:hypothetical protein
MKIPNKHLNGEEKLIGKEKLNNTGFEYKINLF